MANSKKAIAKNIPWYEEPVKKWFAIFSGFLLVAGAGYGFGIIQKSVEFKMDKYELQQECNEKLQKQIEDCQKAKQEYENKRVENLEIVVKDLEQKYGAEQKK